MSNRIDLVYRGVDSNFYHKSWDGTKWNPADSSWKSIGGPFIFEPVTALWGDRFYVFGIGIESQIYMRYLDKPSGSWEEKWRLLDAGERRWAAKPTVVSIYPKSLHVLALAPDTQVYHSFWEVNWKAFTPVGNGYFRDTPSAVSWGPGRLDIFGHGLDGNVYYKWWSEGTGWSEGTQGPFQDLDGPFLHTPKVVTWGKDRLDLLGVARGGTVRHKSWDGKVWSSWNDISSTASSVGIPEAVSWGTKRIDVFIIGQDRGVHHKWYDGCDKWEPSTYDERLGGKAVGQRVSAVVSGKDRIDIFYVGTDAVVYHKTCTAQKGWTPTGDSFESLGGAAASLAIACS